MNGTGSMAAPDYPTWKDVCAVGGEISLRAESDWEGRAHPVEVFTGPFIHAGHTFSVRGRRVPLAEVRCNGPSPVLVQSARLLWRERSLTIAPHQQRSGVGALLELSGSGRFACAAASPGRVFMLFLPEGAGIEVRTDRWLCAAGLHAEPAEMGVALRLDRFLAAEGDGLLLMHGAGGAFEVMLESGDTLRVAPSALLYKEQRVGVLQLAGGAAAPLRCVGPGLIAVQTGWERG